MRNLLVLSFVALFVAACGSEPATPADTGNNTGDQPSPQQNLCTFNSIAVGTQVLFKGTKGSGTAFPDQNKDYIGSVVTLFSSGSAEVNWPELSGSNVQQVSLLLPEGTCNPSLTDTRVVFIGTQGAGTDFPDTTKSYTGKILKVFAEGNALIDWDHLTDNTVELFTVIALEQK